ncbi:MAG: sigma-70 family RNA polymerase sigma factor [Thermoleophilia bacterium]|nr:sigma-70 family RNA polymerase sigma factor [Thermoleophilia bacterium]
MSHARSHSRLRRMLRRRPGGAQRVHEDDLGDVYELVEAARAGDRSALGELFDAFHARIYRFARVRCATVEDAEDVVAETFVAAWKSIERFEWTGAPFAAWLFAIARSQVAGHHRHAASRPQAESGGDERVVELESGVDESAGVEQRMLVDAYLAELPERQRTIVTMRFYGGLDAGEIGAALGMSAAAVRQQQLKALEKMAMKMRREQVA